MKKSTFTLFWVSALFTVSLVACKKEKSEQTEQSWTSSVESIGSQTPGFQDGDISVALFSEPKSVAFDKAGNIYVADWGNHRIRKITPDGMVSTLAGSGIKGFADGDGDSARFNSPADLATDEFGNIYVADQVNHRIRKITPDGMVSTLAGSRIKGYLDGIGTEAQFAKPRGIAVDVKGNVYVSDHDNQRIRQITPDGVVTTLAGSGVQGYADGTGIAAQFNRARDVATDLSGNIYVADTENNRIRKITPNGVVTTFAGNGTSGYADGKGSAAMFRSPKGITIDIKGNIYVADTENHRIRKITQDGVVSTVAGNGTAGFSNGDGSAAQFSSPRGIAVDPQAKYLYIADQENNCIRKIAL